MRVKKSEVWLGTVLSLGSFIFDQSIYDQKELTGIQLFCRSSFNHWSSYNARHWGQEDKYDCFYLQELTVQREKDLKHPPAPYTYVHTPNHAPLPDFTVMPMNQSFISRMFWLKTYYNGHILSVILFFSCEF